jgi:Methyltransferase domain
MLSRRLGLCLALSLSSRATDGYSFSRAKFLSSSAASFLTSAIVMSSNPDASCAATPRYVDSEIDMAYGDKNGVPRTRGMLVRRFTGDSTPYQFPVTPVRLTKQWPEEPPFEPKDFSREDDNDDGAFYTVPRLVYHIDEPAVASLTQYYRKNIKPKSKILDICSSWVSHYPVEFKDTMSRISGSGMNGMELKFNDQLTDFEAKNLNKDPTLPYPDNTFDVVTCVVSIDYLINPIQVLKEVNRVLKPGGKIIISQSNRCFPTKAIRMWLGMNDRQHLELINAYFQYAGGYDERQAFDITATVPNGEYRDPMFIIETTKSQ